MQNSLPLLTLLVGIIFKRVPYGLNSSTEIVQTVLRDLLSGIEGTFVIVDDIMIYAPDTQTHDAILKKKSLTKSKKSGLKLNKEKCKFRTSEVIYQGQKFREKRHVP